ncbi:MAG TPA: kelch repeat-containing protein, partial [Thermoanaerobaculia bacterium]
MKSKLLPVLVLVSVCGLLVGESAAFAEWKEVSRLLTRRRHHTATLLPSGKVLVIGGAFTGTSQPELFDPITGTWASIETSIEIAGSSHTATLLPSGLVLVVAGARAQLFDPVTGVLEETGPLNGSRSAHTATLLRSGKVLVAGGSVSPELYDPATQLWSELQWEPGQPAPSFQPGTATLLPRRFLPSGEVEEVLMVGGSSVEIYRYHPQTDTWTLRPAAPLQQTSFYHTATLLPSGNVLIVGEIAEIYTPTEPTGSRRLAQAPLVWNEHSATLLPSGKVLISGGSPGNGISTHRTELFDPQTETWTAVGSFPFEALSQTATLLATGGVLVAGGYNNVDPFFVLNFAAVFEEPARGWQDEVAPANFFTNPHILLLPSGKALVLGGDVGDYLFDESATGATRWTRIADSSFSRVATDRYTATLLRSGQVLVAGGSQAELFDPAAGGWTQTGPLRTARSGHTATILPSGKVLVAGGVGPGSAPLASVEIYDPQTGTWSETGSLAAARSYHAAILLASGEVLVAGGVEVTSAEIYDPATGQWTPAGSLREARDSARAVLLPSGKVLITGGSQPADQTAEIYDPATRSWELAAPPPRRLKEHTATLLPTGKILMAGGSDAQAEATLVVDIYDPLTGTWEDAPSLSVPRQEHGAVLLQTGKVLVLGGHGFGGDPGTGDLFDLYSLPAGRQRPEVTSVSPLRYGDSFVVEGVGFRGDSQATSGTRQSSAVDFPVIQLRSLDGRRLTWLAPPQLDFSDTRITAGVLPPGLDPGHLLLSVVVAGVPSEPVLAEVQCSLVITRQPGGQLADLGAAVTFEVESEGGEHYQWNRDGQPIPGAIGASYTIGLLTAADAGSVYTVTVRSRCAEETSDPALLAISDSTPPQAAVVSPSGGEYWLLSTSETAKNREVVTWSMSDDIRICRVTVRLLFSIDGGATYGPVPGGPLLTAGPGGACRFGEQPEVSSLVYEIPTQPPGAPGALYKIEVEVTDFDTDPDSAGGARTTVARSPNPFFIVQSNPDAVRTLIVTHSARQESLFPGTRAALATGLQNLANHPRVQGIVVDLASVTGLGPLYDAWDLAPADPAKANDVLFASSGLHDYLREEIFPKFTGIRYLVLVGDDRIIPFGRVPDGTALSETTYVDSPGGDLSSQGTVGKALAAGLYLTDDLLAARRAKPPFSARQIREGAFLPDLPVGRLVETPQEMIATIARFISKDGLLDLSALGEEGHKVLVTGYDFLIDSGQKIRQRWETALGQSEEGTAPVNGALLTAGWGQSSVAARRQALSQHLAGSGGPPYAVINLNGHATHYLEGVPGTGATDIQGLFSEDLPNVEGTVIYAVGCHGGLSVPGSASEDHPHDLPQAFLLRGALAYIANTGYGWGLEEGVGYGERIVELFTEEMTAGGTVVVGDAIRRAKLRYFLQVPSAVNGYDEKTLLQWTLFGLPMYAVRTGIGSPVAGATAGLLDPRGDASRVERLGRVAVERRPVAKASTLPRFLTQLNLHFDLSAEGVYSKLDALGRPVSAAGCPAPATGCYYTLNGVTGGGTGTTDLPIQPYFVYDSRLSGTSQHGALWTGGTYVE